MMPTQIIEDYISNKTGLFETLGHLETCSALPSRHTKILVVSPYGDSHALSVLLTTLFLTKLGYDVQSIHQCPSALFERTLLDFGPDIILITTLLSTGQPMVRELILSIKGGQTPVLLGGFGFDKSWIQENLAADYPVLYYCRRPQDAISMILEGKFQSPILHQGASIAPIMAPYDPTPQTLSHADLPQITDFTPHSRTHHIEDIWNHWIPNRSLYTLHLGFRGKYSKALAEVHPIASAMNVMVSQVKDETLAQTLMKPQSITQWVQAQSHHNTLNIRQGKRSTPFEFPRQSKGDYLCLADYIPGGSLGVMGLMICTVGETFENLTRYFNEGQYQKGLVYHALSVQSAEGLCESLHFELRQEAGIESRTHLNDDEIQSAIYTGKRYSFGYSSCPDLSGQKGLFEILCPENIGITLSPMMMMTPEASVSALVFCHPEAEYFSI